VTGLLKKNLLLPPIKDNVIMKLNKSVVYLLTLSCMLFWGLSFIWSKIAMEVYEPITIIFLRLIVSTLFIFGFIWISKKGERIKRSDYKLIFLSALFNPFLYFLGENFGLKYSTATVTSVIIATIPIFTSISAAILLNERLKKINIAGLVISFLGVLIIIIEKDFSLAANPIGIACLAGAVVAAVAYSLVLKKLSSKYSPFTIVGYQNFIGIFLFLPLFLIFDLDSFIQARPDAKVIGSILALAILASSLAFIFFTLSTREIGVARTGLFTNLIPAFTAGFAFLILGEEFDYIKVFGIFIVIGGVILSQSKDGKQITNVYRFFIKENKGSK
jgi:drug/metabolite transporter (DMT)-like permease